ncbi:CBS domain-containing protein [Desulfoscipio geothermicus]|uniref:CBS domain-containing protein n=1 Tax=Desulfoscipio geothermicus DSM 3669 TaxID=1121426 RepID=A0A1I6CN49_9FIRM|nr:CBS domain-containing protein [Desulfoscipio geothermicus]SFQ94590.1 CBS domain-containing protein [Desulfoscipio geothermicus DSM 3669]
MQRCLRIMDIMRPPADYPTVTPEQTIRQAWHIMGSHYRNRRFEYDNGERLLLVVNKENRLVGLVNGALITKHVDARVYELASRVPGGFLENESDPATACLLPRLKVSDIMLPVENIALKSTETITKALFIMLRNNLGSLPVLNIYRQVVGTVAAGDVFHHHGLGSGYCKTAFMNYDYLRYGLFDDYYANYDEIIEKKEAPQGTQ